MSVFVEHVPIQWVYDLLSPVCAKKVDSGAFVLDLVAYKKIVYSEAHLLFLQRVRPFYHMAHQKYVDREMSFKAFATILRQICKHNNVGFSSQQKFQYSDYTLEYYISLHELFRENQTSNKTNKLFPREGGLGGTYGHKAWA